MNAMYIHDEKLTQKWGPVLEGITNDYDRRVTAQLLENQAKSIVEDKLREDISTGTTTTGHLGTFAKFAFPLVRRVYPELIAKNFVGVQPMQAPVSQVFYLGHSRKYGTADAQTIYSKYNLTYRGLTSNPIGSASGTDAGTFYTGSTAGTGTGLDGDVAVTGFDISNVLKTLSNSALDGNGAPSGTFGGKIAAFPNASATFGWTMNAGERLTGTGIPEMTFHIEQEAVIARTRKMRALWTLEASQDLKAYHNLDLERELTDLLSKELQLEIDRELIEDLRMIAYGFNRNDATSKMGGASLNNMDRSYLDLGAFDGLTNATTAATGTFTPGQFTYDFTGLVAGASNNEFGSLASNRNVFICDLGAFTGIFNPRHVGEAYANLLAIINFAAQDIYKTTMRGPGSWLLTSPVMASILESAAKLEGGIVREDGPTNIGANAIQFKGKFMGRYDLYIDPMFPDDEILVGYKGANAMDAGYIYAPYIPLQQLPTVTDPESFQPRKGILTRYGKVTIEPNGRFYRVIRVVGPSLNYLTFPFVQVTKKFGNSL